jgi:hypothetical protein
MMFCPDCGMNLDEVEVGAPCPGCGGGRRSAIAHAETASVKVMAGEVSLKVTKGDDRPWEEKWLEVLKRLDDVRATYSGDARGFGSMEIDRRVEDFFSECNHVRDWLIGDVARLPTVTVAVIDQHFWSSAPLRTCNAICNTDKHHTRSTGATARIRSTDVTPTGARVTIEVDWALPSATRVDALQLADKCVASWRAFFTTHAIAEPG